MKFRKTESQNGLEEGILGCRFSHNAFFTDAKNFLRPGSSAVNTTTKKIGLQKMLQLEAKDRGFAFTVINDEVSTSTFLASTSLTLKFSDWGMDR